MAALNPDRHPEPACIDSRQLLPSSGILTIIHQGERYTLRVTKTGKLILTK